MQVYVLIEIHSQQQGISRRLWRYDNAGRSEISLLGTCALPMRENKRCPYEMQSSPNTSKFASRMLKRTIFF